MNIFSRLVCLLLGFCFLLPTTTFATALQFGITLPILIKGKDPEGLHGYRAVAWYQPPSWVWSRVNVYLAGGVGHWWSHGAKMNRSINIVAFAPVLRCYLLKTPNVSPYLEASIGPSYLSRTRFADRNLGMHFAFQDEVGVGAVFGKAQHFFASLSALHYSNGSLSSMNAGITVPLILNVGYSFG